MLLIGITPELGKFLKSYVLLGGFEMDAVFKTEEGVFNYRVAGVWIQNGCVLLHKNVNDGHWALPGGRVAVMEESNNAVQREFQEELGVEIKVDRFLWSSENFFIFNGKNYHEIGFYYLISSITEKDFKLESFFGLEGKRLIYKWVPIAELHGISIYPEFLKEGLQELPKHSQHIITKDVATLNDYMQ